MIAKINQLLKEVEALKPPMPKNWKPSASNTSVEGAINDLMADFRNVAAEQKKKSALDWMNWKTKAQEKI